MEDIMDELSFKTVAPDWLHLSMAQDHHSIHITRAVTSTDSCWKDHHLIWSVMSICITQKWCKQKNLLRRGSILSACRTLQDYLQQYLSEKLSNLPDDLETIDPWESFKKDNHEVCKELPGFSTKKYQSWFNEYDKEIQACNDWKRRNFEVWQKDISYKQKKNIFTLNPTTRGSFKEWKNELWKGVKAKEIQKFSDCHNMHSFFSSAKTIYGPNTQGAIPLRSKDSLL